MQTSLQRCKTTEMQTAQRPVKYKAAAKRDIKGLAYWERPNEQTKTDRRESNKV